MLAPSFRLGRAVILFSLSGTSSSTMTNLKSPLLRNPLSEVPKVSSTASGLVWACAASRMER